MDTGCRPIGVTSYYKDIINIYKKKLEDINGNIVDNTNQLVDNYKYLKDNQFKYFKDYNIDLTEFDEYNNNRYIDGKLLEFIQNKLIDNAGNDDVCKELFYIFNYAKAQKVLQSIRKQTEVYNKILKLKSRQYVKVLNIFYNQVHKLMVKYGFVYRYNELGYIGINRFRIDTSYTAPSMIDYKATKIRKQELIAQGKRLYNKFDEKWCKEHNIEYNGIKYVVPTTKTHCYELILFKKTRALNNVFFYANQYRAAGESRLTLEQLMEMYPTVDEILTLNMDVKCKANLCCQLDDNIAKILTRYEDEKAIRNRKANRED